MQNTCGETYLIITNHVREEVAIVSERRAMSEPWPERINWSNIGGYARVFPNLAAAEAEAEAKYGQKKQYHVLGDYKFVLNEALAKFIERGDFPFWSRAGMAGLQEGAGLKAATRSI
jgi:hypothetical protein